MSRITVPVGQKLHTNVVVVRLARAKKKFEIACYPNKVQEWRSGIEKDIDEVLQTDRVFVNVGQGEFAKDADMHEAFGTTKETEVCIEILRTGELQVSEKEREKENEAMFHEVSAIVVEKCVDSNTNRALTVGLVERAMKEVGFYIVPNKSAKQQALKVIPELAARFPITRAKMLIRVTVPAEHITSVKPTLGAHVATTMNEIQPANAAAAYTLVGMIEPSQYREIDEILREKGTLEVLNPRVVAQA